MAFNASVETYRDVLRIRESSPAASQGSVGEAMTELGFGLLFTLQWKEARTMLRKGVHMMEEASYRPGFIVRGKKKLAVSLLLSGDIRGARRARHEAEELAVVSRIGIQRPH